jgi:hypothetical protein
MAGMEVTTLTSSELDNRIRQHRLTKRLINWSAGAVFAIIISAWIGIVSHFANFDWLKEPLSHQDGMIWLVGLCVCSFVHMLLSWYEQVVHCPRRLRRFHDVASALDTLRRESFILYLRNATLDTLVEAEAVSLYGIGKSACPRPVESLITDIVKSYGVGVVALWSSADSNSHPDVSYVHVENGTWQDLVLGLAARAVAIVVHLREQTPGVPFETALIGQDSTLEAKTFLIVSSSADLVFWASKIPNVSASYVLSEYVLVTRFWDNIAYQERRRRSDAIASAREWFSEAFARFEQPTRSRDASVN